MAMSFDVFLMHFERGQETGADRAAVAAVFRELGANGLDADGRYEVPIDDLWASRRAGEQEQYCIQINAGGLDGQEEFTGCAMFLRAFSPGIARVVYRIAEAGGLTIVSASDAPALLPPGVDPADLPDEDYFTWHRRVTSAGELYAALTGEYDQYSRWRDRALSRAAGARPSPAARIYRWARALLRSR
jgi:hypothetical protein